MINKEDLEKLLSEINVICKDNGKKFTKTDRLSVIQDILDTAESGYFRTYGNLFRLYSRKKLSEITNPVLLISTHVDCKSSITQCFSSITEDNNILKGTYDNSITNAAVVYLMATNQLPDNVLVAFTGDEEEGANGAKQVIKKLEGEGINYKCISLDVTNQGWSRKTDFSIENESWNANYGKMIMKIISMISPSWIYVPMNIDKIPSYVPKEHLIVEDAWEDESCIYSQSGIESFSLCIPVDGDMHSDAGVFARLSSLEKYTECLLKLAKELAGEDIIIVN